MKKVIFLDFDGVLNPKWWNRGKPSDKYGVLFEAKSVACLRKIINETGADIVISSSWKCMVSQRYRRCGKKEIFQAESST